MTSILERDLPYDEVISNCYYLHPTVASHEVAALTKCEAVGLVLTKKTAL